MDLSTKYISPKALSIMRESYFFFVGGWGGVLSME